MSGRLEINGSGLVVRTPYSPSLLPVLRGLPGARWDGDEKVWRVSDAPEALPTLLQTARTHGWSVEPAILDRAKEVAKVQEAGAEGADKRAETPGLYAFQRDGVRWQARRPKSILGDEMGLGKRLALGTPVLTPTGWVPIEVVQVGDKVVGRDGRPTTVTGTYRHENRPLYRVSFSDGASIDADDEHLWAVQHIRNDGPHRNPSGRWRTMTTDQLVTAGVRDGAGNCTWRIPLVEPILHSPRNTALLPADPYLVGVALGDGHHKSKDRWELCTDREILDRVGARHRKPHETSEYTGYGVVDIPGLHPSRAEEKLTPEGYLFSSPEERRALLAGLLDTDGHVNPSGTVQFTSVSHVLSSQVVSLVQSLGGTATLHVKLEPTYTYKGERRVGRPAYIVTIRLTENPFYLSRKAEKWRPLVKYKPTRIISEIERINEGSGICISVDAPDHLYVVGNYIVTHNTIQTLASLPENKPVFVVCTASTKDVWARECGKWRPDYRPVILSGRGTHRWPEPGEMVIANYDILPQPPKTDKNGKVVDQGALEIYDSAPKDLVLVVDEVHACKGAKTRRTRAVKLLQTRSARVFGLTGTPLLNNPPELWQVLETVGVAEEAFTHYGRFWKLMGGRKEGWGTVWGTPSPQAAECLKRVFLRRERKDVLPDLPGKTFRTIQVKDLKKGLRNRLDEVMAAWKSRTKVEGEDLPDVLPPFEEMSEIRTELAAAKIPTMLDFVENHEEQKEPLVVFADHRAPIDVLAKRPGWAAITGDVTGKERARVIDAFQNGLLKGVALTIGAGREGITLTRASQMLFVDLAWTPAWNSQAQDRICRIGQTRGCGYTTLVADHPVDQRLEELLQEKKDIIQATVEAATVKTTPMTLAELLQGADGASKDAEVLAKQERDRKVSAGEFRNCPTCQKEVEAREAGPNSKNPGRKYFSCRPCNWFVWADEKETPALIIENLPSGGYALDNQEGGTSFYIINRPEKDRWAGWTFLRLQMGPEARTLGSVDPHGRVRGANNVRSILERILEDPKAAMSRYGRELGFCGACGLPLTNETSREMGIGPICAAKF